MSGLIGWQPLAGFGCCTCNSKHYHRKQRVGGGSFYIFFFGEGGNKQLRHEVRRVTRFQLIQVVIAGRSEKPPSIPPSQGVYHNSVVFLLVLLLGVVVSIVRPW